jgi:pyruvate dehydrogenase (quinone)
MVKLEMEQVGLPEYGTKLANPDFSEVAKAIGLTGIRVERPGDVDEAVSRGLETAGPVLIDVLTNPDEIAIPPAPTVHQGWGFAIAKTKEFIESHE